MGGNSLVVLMDPRLPLQGAWVQSLVWKLRSHKPCSAAKKEKKTKYKLKKREHNYYSLEQHTCSKIVTYFAYGLSTPLECIRTGSLSYPWLCSQCLQGTY